ncbi:MAG: polymerase subunit tau [Planctomycetota bacterium]
MPWQATRGRAEITGQDAVVERFVRAAALGRIAGSYLFIGPPGVGKSTVALALAKALVCERPRPGLVACGSCASCVQADGGSHPDIDVVARPADRSTIPLEALIGDPEHRMREGLCWRLLLRPALGGRKVAIILDADHLSEEAANCLLKTLEEPPDRAVIILVGTTLERQLPTIRSRCQIVRFQPLDEETVLRIITAEATTGGQQADPAALRACAAAAGGSLARARQLLDPQMTLFRGRLLDLLGRRPLHGVELARETLELVEAAGKEAPPRRARLRLVLDAAVDCFRAALRQAVTGERPADPAVARAVAVWAAGPDEAAAAIEATLAAAEAIDRNAHLTVLIDAWTAGLEQPSLARGL